MWVALKSTLVEILDSKKALVLVAVVIAQVVGKLGFDFDQSAFDRIVVVVSIYLGAQGYADHGSAIAKGNVQAAAIAATIPANSNAPNVAVVNVPPAA